jgi:hypothetical protein
MNFLRYIFDWFFLIVVAFWLYVYILIYRIFFNVFFCIIGIKKIDYEKFNKIKTTTDLEIKNITEKFYICDEIQICYFMGKKFYLLKKRKNLFINIEIAQYEYYISSGDFILTFLKLLD